MNVGVGVEVITPWGGADPDDLAILVAASLRHGGHQPEIRLQLNDKQEATAIQVFIGTRPVASFPCRTTKLPEAYLDALNAAARSWKPAPI